MTTEPRRQDLSERSSRAVPAARREALRSYLDRPPLQGLWQLVRAELESGRNDATVRLENLREDERLAIAGLLGLPPLPDRPVGLKLSHLDRSLRASRFAVGLAEAIALIGGPLRGHPTETAALRDHWQALWDSARAHPVVQTRPALQPWLDDLARGDYSRHLVQGREKWHLERALDVLAALPAEGRRLNDLAQDTLGDPHALDFGRPVAGLVLRALAVLAKRPFPAAAAERQKLWGWAGVIYDDLSSDVLTLGLRPTGTGTICHWLCAFAAAGEPARITLRQLEATDLGLTPGTRVFVCQHPVVVAVAADRLGASCAPLICAGGLPNAAVRGLLSALAQNRAQLCYHGDFDWSGLRIANALHRTVPFAPWRYEASDYLAACATAVEKSELSGVPVYAIWDHLLTGQMVEKDVAIEEETVLEQLLEDLGT